MTAIAAHTLTEVLVCKAYGCGQEQRVPIIERGPYAGFCPEHYEAMREKMGAAQRKRYSEQPDLASANGTERRDAADGVPSYEGKARLLVAIGREVDLAFHKAEKAKRQCEPKIRAAQEAKEQAERLAQDFNDAVRDLLD